jgi:hypothetical protein
VIRPTLVAATLMIGLLTPSGLANTHEIGSCRTSPRSSTTRVTMRHSADRESSMDKATHFCGSCKP